MPHSLCLFVCVFKLIDHFGNCREAGIVQHRSQSSRIRRMEAVLDLEGKSNCPKVTLCELAFPTLSKLKTQEEGPHQTTGVFVHPSFELLHRL